MNKQQQIQHYKDTKGSPINQEDFSYVDSKQIQIRSVLEFMDALGYDYCPAFKSTFCARYGGGFKGCEVISFNTAVKLHDSAWNKTSDGFSFVPEFSKVNKLGGGYYDKTFKVDGYTLQKARACKIFCRIYLHCTKNGVIKSYKNQVQFAFPFYEQQFLNPILDEEYQ